MFADLLFIEDPKEKNKKNYYINDRNYFTKNSLRMRSTHINFYNNAIKSRKEEQKRKPMPKILYSTAEAFYRPQQDKAKEFIETQKIMVQDLVDLMKNFTNELESEENNKKEDLENNNANDNKIMINKRDKENQKEEFFLTNKNSKLTKHYNHTYISNKQKLMEDLEFAKATNTDYHIINNEEVKYIKNKERLLKDNLILDNNYGKYKFSRTGLVYPQRLNKYELPNFNGKYGDDEEYFNYKKKVKNPTLVYNRISNFEEALNKDLEMINKTYGKTQSRTRFSKNPLLKKYMEMIPLYDIYKDLKVIENRYVGSKYKYKLLPLYNKRLSNLDKLADRFYKIQNNNAELASFIKISNSHNNNY